ncbi:MAG TPA: ribose-5-phosphate isomerase RpiA [Acidimicrobiales bacterium]
MEPQDEAKQAAGRAAAAVVEDGMRIGLGTGSTVRFALEALGDTGFDLTCVATSSSTEDLAGRVGLRLVAPDEAVRLDVTIDGADEVDAGLNLTKGGGGALTREKIVAAMAERFIVVADRSKVVPLLGPFGTPIEVLSFAPAVVADRLRNLGAASVERRDGLSDNGGVLLDAHFGEIDDPHTLAAELSAIPGVVEHGIFLADLVSSVVVADADGSIEILGQPLG